MKRQKIAEEKENDLKFSDLENEIKFLKDEIVKYKGANDEKQSKIVDLGAYEKDLRDSINIQIELEERVKMEEKI